MHTMNMKTLRIVTFILLILSCGSAALEALDYSYYIENGAVTIGYYSGTNAVEVVPDTIADLPVVAIASWAFQYNTNLASVTFPNSLVSIANGVFYQCTALTNVTFGNHQTTIGDSAFYNCHNLTQLIFPSSVTNLGAACFQSCYGVQEIYFRGNAPSVGNDVFLAIPAATVYYFSGTTNWFSYLGSRPTVLWDPHILTVDPTFGMSAGRFGFTVTNMADIRVIIEATTNLSGTGWTQVRNSTTLNQSLYFSDPDTATYSKRLYRLSSP
jgi:BspA type Leucine rich repeat region (6 copies)